MVQINSVRLISYKIMALQLSCFSRLNIWQLLQLNSRSTVNFIRKTIDYDSLLATLFV